LKKKTTKTRVKMTESTERRRVALVFGGATPEHEISISSAAQVAGALGELARRQPLAVQPIYINREGQWIWGPFDEARPPASERIAQAERWDVEPEKHGATAPVDFVAALARLSDERIDTAMLILHGKQGEDGRIQAALDLAGIPYTGSGMAASALALDKGRCQAVLAAASLPIAPSVVVRGPGLEGLERVEPLVGFPCVVKPIQGGSSVGISIVLGAESLRPALARAFEIDEEALVEKHVTGRELTCGVVERDGRLELLPVTEIIPPEGRWFDYEAKYTPGMTREVTPAEIPGRLATTIQNLARAAHLAIGCRGFSRVDFIADPEPPIIIEVNTIPGMTGTSLLPQAAAAAGIDFPMLLDLILASARYG
jgi:D-alanine-D-alanine ligase